VVKETEKVLLEQLDASEVSWNATCPQVETEVYANGFGGGKDGERCCRCSKHGGHLHALVTATDVSV
jgi:hypothetical protein